MTFVLLSCALCAAQTAENTNAAAGAPQDRLLLPHNFLRGYADFQFAPPHNEPDLSLCALGVGPQSGPGACAAFARYVWSGYIEFQPFGRTPLRRLFLILEPKLFGGETVPQHSYTASPSLILTEQNIGAGISLPRQFELRLMHHWTKLLGRYGGSPSAVTLRPDGPYGLYTTVGVRWYFGGYGPARH
jgi:hypothetical protein